MSRGAPHQASDVDLFVEGLEEDPSAAAVTDVERVMRVPVDDLGGAVVPARLRVCR